MLNQRVITSRIAPDVLVQHMATDDGLQDARCLLITATRRDVYLVRSRIGRRMLIIYRHNQQTLDQITAEWQFVASLVGQHVPVVPALPAHDDHTILTFDATEGRRFAGVTDDTPGHYVRHRPNTTATRRYDQIIATIHALADGMPAPCTRSGRELGPAFQRSMAAMQAVVIDRPNAVPYRAACGHTLQPDRGAHSAPATPGGRHHSRRRDPDECARGRRWSGLGDRCCEAWPRVVGR